MNNSWCKLATLYLLVWLHVHVNISTNIEGKITVDVDITNCKFFQIFQYAFYSISAILFLSEIENEYFDSRLLTGNKLFPNCMLLNTTKINKTFWVLRSFAIAPSLIFLFSFSNLTKSCVLIQLKIKTKTILSKGKHSSW